MQNSSSNSHGRVQRQTSSHQNPVKRPAIRTSAQIQAENLKRRQALAAKMNRERVLNLKSTTKIKNSTKQTPEEPIAPATTNPIVARAEKKIASASTLNTKPQLSMKERKEKAIESAIKQMKSENQTEKRGFNRSFFTFKRVSLAICCSFLVVAVTTYFIKVSMPNLSVQFAAAQSGVEALYPTYIPKDYSLANVTSDNEKITMIFKTTSGESFSIDEETSSWNSTALESNYAKINFEDYSTVREQGLTIFISGSNCVWVNGGKMFIISSNSNLTKTQLVSIATSL